MSLYPSNPEIGEVFNNRQWNGTAWVALNNPLSVEYTTDQEFTGHTSASANVHGILNSASLVYADELNNYLTQSSASSLYTSSIDFNNHESASANVHGIINSASLVYTEDIENRLTFSYSSASPTNPLPGETWFDTSGSYVDMKYWDAGKEEWRRGSAGYPQPEEPVVLTTGSIWVDTDAEDPNYPAYPTVIYSPTDPSASLTFADVGTIWVDENAAEMVETVVPAVLYSDTEPDHLGQGQAGYLWVDSDADIIEYNMNEYARKDELINSFMLAGM
jgi:hypothetical protein